VVGEEPLTEFAHEVLCLLKQIAGPGDEGKQWLKKHPVLLKTLINL